MFLPKLFSYSSSNCRACYRHWRSAVGTLLLCRCCVICSSLFVSPRNCNKYVSRCLTRARCAATFAVRLGFSRLCLRVTLINLSHSNSSMRNIWSLEAFEMSVGVSLDPVDSLHPSLRHHIWNAMISLSKTSADDPSLSIIGSYEDDYSH